MDISMLDEATKNFTLQEREYFDMGKTYAILELAAKNEEIKGLHSEDYYEEMHEYIGSNLKVAIRTAVSYLLKGLV